MWLLRFVCPIADVASLVALATVSVQLVVAVESSPTETTLGMPFEPTLVDRTRVVVSKLLMPLKLGSCEQLVFMGEDFLVSRAKIAGKVLAQDTRRERGLRTTSTSHEQS